MSPQHESPVDSETEQRTPSKSNDTGVWRMVSFILGLILVGSTVFGVAGKAFYVTRSEYSEKSQSNAVELSQVHMALDSIRFSMKDTDSQLHAAVDTIKTTLKEQEQAFRAMAETVNNIKIDAFKNLRQKVQ